MLLPFQLGKQVQGIGYKSEQTSKPIQWDMLYNTELFLDKSTLTFNGIGHIIKGAKFGDVAHENGLLSALRVVTVGA